MVVIIASQIVDCIFFENQSYLFRSLSLAWDNPVFCSWSTNKPAPYFFRFFSNSSNCGGALTLRGPN